MIEGSCLCGALRYEVTSPLGALTHCHCGVCRKHHGAPFASFVTVPLERFHAVAGEDALIDYASSAARARRACRVCSAVAPVVVDGEVRVPAGNLVGALGEVEARHVSVASKAPWHVLGEGPQRCEGAAPGWPLEEALVPRRDSEITDGATHGSCMCGEVTFTVMGDPARWLQCHCSRCRRGRSAAHGSNTFYPRDRFAWRSGRGSVRSYAPPDAARFAIAFCGGCGGGAPVEREGVPFVLVPAGLLDGDLAARPQAHIHVASKARWYAITDALPQFEELPT